jgi:hypothetical protein
VHNGTLAATVETNWFRAATTDMGNGLPRSHEDHDASPSIPLDPRTSSAGCASRMRNGKLEQRSPASWSWWLGGELFCGAEMLGKLAQKNFRRGGSYPPPEVRHGFEKPLVKIDRVGGM